MSRPTASLEGGPLSGAVYTFRTASVIVTGDRWDRPGEIALYRRTERRDADGLTIYEFTGWECIGDGLD